MALSYDKIGLLKTAVELLAKSIAKGRDIPEPDVSSRMDWVRLKRFLGNIMLENELRKKSKKPAERLIEAADALAGAHADAAGAEVDLPSEEQLNTFKTKLKEFHKLVAENQRYEAAAKFAEVLVQLVEEEESSDQSDNG